MVAAVLHIDNSAHNKPWHHENKCAAQNYARQNKNIKIKLYKKKINIYFSAMVASSDTFRSFSIVFISLGNTFNKSGHIVYAIISSKKGPKSVT